MHVETLLGEHPSAPHNPVIAGAFFRRGDIETWGRGIRRIFEACRVAREPDPHLRSLANDLWLEFPFAPEYLTAVGGTPPGSHPGSRTTALDRLRRTHTSRVAVHVGTT